VSGELLTAGSDLGFLVAAFLLGLRHGVDWDHIAAITDITASQHLRGRGVWLGSIYALGHAAVVFALGVAAILLGDRLPPWVDTVMGRVVGVTLVVLGVYVVFSMVRYGREFRLQSRWMLAIAVVRRAYRWILARLDRMGTGVVTHEHPHVTAQSFHHDPETEVQPVPGEHVHIHRHHHEVPATYGTRSALIIGALHGVGAETPTQVLIFLTAAGAGGAGAGIAALIVFLVGLFTANSVVTAGSAFGLVSATRYPRIYLGFGALTAVMSLSIGFLFLSGTEGTLPTLLGG
jgi:high-affinity nickel-transport protein